MQRIKSGTWFGIAMMVVFLIALTSALVSRAGMERYLQDIDGPLCCAMCGCYMKKGEPHSMDDGEPVHSKCLWGDNW